MLLTFSKLILSASESLLLVSNFDVLQLFYSIRTRAVWKWRNIWCILLQSKRFVEYIHVEKSSYKTYLLQIERCQIGNPTNQWNLWGFWCNSQQLWAWNSIINYVENCATGFKQNSQTTSLTSPTAEVPHMKEVFVIVSCMQLWTYKTPSPEIKN